MATKNLYEERAELVSQMRRILDDSDSESRDLTSEDEAKYEALEADVGKYDEQIEIDEQRAERRSRLAEREATIINQPPTRPQTGIVGDTLTDTREREMSAFRSYLVNPRSFRAQQELAALQMDSDTGGGTLTIPETFIQQLIDGLDETLAIRSVATILPLTNAASIGAPSLDNDPSDAEWTVELSTGSADSTMSTGKRSLTPHPLAQLVKVSKTLLRRSPIPVDSLVRSRLQFKLGVTEEKGFLTGSGSQQPLGLFTASADGVSTPADVSTDNTSSAITADGLVTALYSLKEQYLRSSNLRWLFHRDAIKMIRKLKDGNGDYLWTRGLANDRQATILDVPYMVSEFAPNTFTTGLYVGAIGDFSYYWIAESLAMSIEVASELYMGSNEDGYFIRAELDGMPVLEEAFARVTLA